MENTAKTMEVEQRKYILINQGVKTIRRKGFLAMLIIRTECSTKTKGKSNRHRKKLYKNDSDISITVNYWDGVSAKRNSL